MPVLALLMLTAMPLTDVSFLRDYAETRRFLAGRPVGAKVTPDGAAVLFLRSPPRDARQVLYELDLKTGKTTEWLSPEKVLQGAQETLSVRERAELERRRVSARGFTSFQLSEDGARILVALSGKLYVVERPSGTVAQLKTGPGASIDPRFSPDGKRVAYVRDNDVRVVDLATNRERRVTKGGTDVKPQGLAEHVAQEEMSRFNGFWFSPDGKQLAFQQTDHTGVEQLTISDPLHPEAEADRFFYPRPGRANAQVKLGLIAVRGGPVAWVDWDRAAFPYLATVKWPKHGPLTVLVQNRAQTKQQLLAVDAKSGATKLLLEEVDDAWLNLDQAFPHWLEDGSGFFWASERSGAWQVELRKKDGALDAVWVKGDAGFAGWVGLSEAAKAVYFTGGPSPVESHLFRVVAGGAPERVVTPTTGPATELGSLGKDGKVLLVTSTSTKAMPRTHALPLDGTGARELPSVAEEPKLRLNLEFLEVGPQRMHAAVLKPGDFDAKKTYPVVLQVYGGPGHLEVLQSTRENLVLQWLANQGFLVVKLDGRGTPRRGRAWERAIKHDFATIPVGDQVDGLRALAKRVPQMDLKRVGVTGWSFGGYLAALLGMTHGEVFKSAVAGAPVVDWLDYDTHYTERYLGLPAAHPEAYAVSSLLTYVEKAQRPLLVIHGTADDNVYFLHTLKLSDALFKAGAPHSVLPLSNFTHMVPDPLVTERLYSRIALFFRETL